jgi:hypothetical protein
MKPRVSILSSDFKYVPAVCTDVRRTFARIRREQREQAKQQRLTDAANAAIRVAAANDAASYHEPLRLDTSRMGRQINLSQERRESTKQCDHRSNELRTCEPL